MMRGSNEKMTRSSLVVTCHDRRGSCVVMTADGPASSLTAAMVSLTFSQLYWEIFYFKILRPSWFFDLIGNEEVGTHTGLQRLCIIV